MSNNIFIDLTEELANKGWTVHWEFNSDPTLLKYNHCITIEDCATENPDYAYDVNRNGVWNYRLDNLENAEIMFVVGEDEETYAPIGSPALVSFNADLPKVTLGWGMFGGCSNLTTFNGNLSNLIDGYNMFAFCPNLKSFTSDLSSLMIGAFMFGNNYKAAEKFVYDNITLSGENISEIPAKDIENEIDMLLQYTGPPTSLDTASVQNIANTINDVSNITPPADLDPYDAAEWKLLNIGIDPTLKGNSDIEVALTTIKNKGWNVTPMYGSEITSGEGLLKYNNCRTYVQCKIIDTDVATDVDENGAWNYSLDNLEISGWANHEFTEVNTIFFINLNTPNTSLKSFNVNLPKLTDGTGMFGACIELTSFSTPLPNLTDGTGMFLSCISLTEWNIDLPKLTKGYDMFRNCTNLTSFRGDLPALTGAAGMFGSASVNCTRLDLASVQHIANTINDITGTITPDPTTGLGYISIGMQTAIRDTAELETALAAIRAKGWTVSELYA